MAIDLIGVSVHELSVGVFLRGLCYLNAFFGTSRFERSFVVNVNGEKNESKKRNLSARNHHQTNERNQHGKPTNKSNKVKHMKSTNGTKMLDFQIHFMFEVYH